MDSCCLWRFMFQGATPGCLNFGTKNLPTFPWSIIIFHIQVAILGILHVQKPPNYRALVIIGKKRTAPWGDGEPVHAPCWTMLDLHLTVVQLLSLAFRSIFHSNHPMWYKPGQAARPSQFWMNLLFFFAAEPRHTCTAHEPTPNVTRGTHGANPKNTVLKSPRVEQRNMATGSQYKDLSPTVPRSLRPNHGSVRLESWRLKWRLKWNVKGWPTSFWFLGLKWYNLDTVLLCCIKFRWMTSFRLLLRLFWLLLEENPNGRWA